MIEYVIIAVAGVGGYHIGKHRHKCDLTKEDEQVRMMTRRVKDAIGRLPQDLSPEHQQPKEN